MSMKWQGTAQMHKMTARMAEEVRVAAARVCMEVAKETRDRALEGFYIYGIGMVTGRSRALYAAAPGEGMFTPGATKVSYDVGYLNWPKRDNHSPDVDIPFYPWMLNFGTSKMPARPFHTAAIDAMEPVFYHKMRAVLDHVVLRYGRPL